METLGTIENVNIIKTDNGAVTYTTHARIDDDGSDNRFGDPCWQAGTSLRHNGKSLDAESVSYIVVPPLILTAVPGVVLGCQVHCINHANGMECDAVVGDVGPHAKIGEMSCQCARDLGMSGNPNTGGTDDPVIEYQIFPGQSATVKGETFELQPYRKS
jgi:hypothetical protein